MIVLMENGHERRQARTRVADAFVYEADLGQRKDVKVVGACKAQLDVKTAE